jgi:hypothetical protein
MRRRKRFDAWLEPFRDLGMRRNVSARHRRHGSFEFYAWESRFNVVQTIRITTCGCIKNVDTFERVRAADLQQTAVVLASFLYHAAIRKEKIPIAKPATSSAASP